MTERDLVKDFRDYADHPASTGFVPISPTKLLQAVHEIERMRNVLGVLAVHALQRDWEDIRDWARSVKVEFPDGKPQVRL